MGELMENYGQAILAAIAAVALLQIALFVLFRVDDTDGILTMAEYIFLNLDSLLP